MDNQHLVKMANSIGSFFEAETDKTKGAKSVAEHIKSFWDPRMRRQILAYLDESKGAGFDKLVLDALTTHRSLLGG